MKNVAAKIEPNPKSGKPDPERVDKARSFRPDCDLSELEHMLATIRQRRADAETSLAEAQAELSVLDERAKIARGVLTKFCDGGSQDANPYIVNQAKSTLETVDELRPWAERKAQRARNLLRRESPGDRVSTRPVRAAPRRRTHHKSDALIVGVYGG